MIDEDVIREAKAIIEEAKRREWMIGARAPRVMMAAAIYLIKMKEHTPITQTDLAEEFGVSVASLRDSFHLLLKTLGLTWRDFWAEHATWSYRRRLQRGDFHHK